MKNIIFKIKKSLVKTAEKMWQDVYLLFFLFLILDIIIGFGFFLKYYLYQEKIEAYPLPKINQDLLNDFSAEFQKREQNFKNADNKTYSDPFKGITK